MSLVSAVDVPADDLLVKQSHASAIPATYLQAIPQQRTASAAIPTAVVSPQSQPTAGHTCQLRSPASEHEKAKLMDEIERLHQSDALLKVSLLERRVEEREKEIEDLLCRSNEQRSSTVHVFESLLATERAAQAEANCRAEAMSLQLQATQSKLDKLHQELTSILIVETALDSKLRTVSHRKRSRDNYIGIEPRCYRRWPVVQDRRDSSESTRLQPSKATTWLPNQLSEDSV
ncbi:hypothetical protein BHM03_00058596 [Ensete ventricosum]|nr:hypothetical protein BHM03_00058596 [Ensete ventricosum]